MLNLEKLLVLINILITSSHDPHAVFILILF